MIKVIDVFVYSLRSGDIESIVKLDSNGQIYEVDCEYHYSKEEEWVGIYSIKREYDEKNKVEVDVDNEEREEIKEVIKDYLRKKLKNS